MLLIFRFPFSPFLTSFFLSSPSSFVTETLLAKIQESQSQSLIPLIMQLLHLRRLECSITLHSVLCYSSPYSTSFRVSRVTPSAPKSVSHIIYFFHYEFNPIFGFLELFGLLLKTRVRRD